MEFTLLYIVASVFGLLLGVAFSVLYNKMYCSGLTQTDYDNLRDNYSKAQDNYLEQLRVTIELREKLIKEIELNLKIMLEKGQLIVTYKGLITEVHELRQKLSDCEARQKLSDCEASVKLLDKITACDVGQNHEVYA